jgi:hypothetical protein
MQKALPGMRPDRIAEERLVATPFEPISSAILLVGVPDGQFIEASDRVVNDRSVAHGRSNDSVALTHQNVDDALQTLPLDRERSTQHPDQILIQAGGRCHRLDYLFSPNRI